MHASSRWRKVFQRGIGLGALLVAIVISGCGSSTTTTATVTVTITAPTTDPTIEQGQTVNLAATASQTGGVTWSLFLNGGCLATTCGTLTNTTTTSAIYNAPASVTAATTVVVIATSVANTAATTEANITVTPPISITVSPNFTTAAAAGGSRNFTASVVYDQNSQGVNWSLSGTGCAGSACGTLTSATITSVTYNAPLTQPVQNNAVTLTATSIADSSRSGSSTISITAPLPIAVSISNKAAFAVAGGAAITFNATVQNDPSSAGVNWTIAAGGSDCQSHGCGTLSGATTSSVTYTPPVGPPPSAPNNQPTITATSIADGSKSDVDSFSILAAAPSACASTPTGAENMLSGQYAFFAQGFQGSSGAAIAASFAANGSGGVSGGDLDSNSSAGYQHATITSGSSYTVGADPTGAGKVGCVTLATSASTTITFHFALGVVSSGIATQGRIIEFDDTGTGTLASGILRRQDPSSFSLAALKPNYAFGLDGVDSTGFPVAIGGSFAVNAGTISSGVTDVNDKGTISAGTSGGTGHIGSVSGTDGRATATFTAGGGASYAWAVYVVNASQIFIVETDALSSGTLTSGRALATGNSFSSTSLAGNYVVHYTGTLRCNSVPCAAANLGVFGFTSGSFSGTESQYDSYSGSQTFSPLGTYTVDPASGRASLVSTTKGLPVFYTVSPAVDGISAFLVGQDSSAAFGLAEFQPSQTYSTASLAGNYFVGTEDPHDATVTHIVGTLAINGSTGGVTGTESLSAPIGLDASHAIAGTISMNANGTGVIFFPSFTAIANGSRILYINIGADPAVITILDRQ